MLKKTSSMLFAVLLFFLLSGCANLSKIDRPVCVELSLARGYCTTIISGRGFYVDDKNLFEDKTWFEQSHEMIRVPVSTWTELKKYLIMNCKRSKTCNREIDTWTRSIEKIDNLAEKKDEIPTDTPPSILRDDTPTN